MGQETDLLYFERRATEERRKAQNADDPLTYRVHIDFARAYERRLIDRSYYRRPQPVSQEP